MCLRQHSEQYCPTRDRELGLVVCLFFVFCLFLFCFVLFFANHTRNAFLSSIGMCCLCFFYKTVSLEKKIAQNLRNRKKWRTSRETVRRAVKPYDTRWNRESWEVYTSDTSGSRHTTAHPKLALSKRGSRGNIES